MNKKRVIVIDDNLAELRLTEEAFSMCHFDDIAEILTVSDGTAAIELFQQFKDWDLNIDLVLTDLNMPAKTGIDVVNYLVQNNYCKTYKIINSNSNRMDDIYRCFEAGADAFFSKPLIFDEFVSVINDIKGLFNLSFNAPEQTNHRSELIFNPKKKRDREAFLMAHLRCCGEL